MSSSGVDGVELAVLSNRFEGAVLSMMNTLLRTSRSGVINNGRDFSCCVLTADDELLAMAESQPIHVLAGPDLMAQAMKRVPPACSSAGRRSCTTRRTTATRTRPTTPCWCR